MGFRGWQVKSGAALVAVVALLAGCAGQGGDGSAGNGQTESVSDGDVTVSYGPGVFQDGVAPTVSAADVEASDFIEAFGLTTASGQVATASVSAEAQPTGDVEVSFRLDPASVDPDEIPAVFYLEPDMGLWLPIPSEYSEDGTLVGTTSHFTDFAAAIISGIESAERGAQWLRYQVARGVGARAGGVECSGDWPEWVVGMEVEEGLNAPLPACAEGDDEQLRLRVVNNRPYGMVLDGPVPPSDASYAPSLDAEDVVATALSGNKPLTFDGDVLIPAGMQVDLYWQRGELDPGEVIINGRVTPATLVLDGVYLSALKIAEFVSQPIDLLSGVGTCLQDAFDTAMGSTQEAAGSLAEAAGVCLTPLAESAGGTAKESSKKLLLGVEVGLLMGRGAQTVLDASAALNEPHRIALIIAESLPEPGQGAALLSDIRTDWSGVGPTGDPVDVTVGTYLAPMSATQWVGCGVEPAWGEFDLSGETRLTAMLGKRSFTPRGLRIRVQVSVDGAVVEEYSVANTPVPVDLSLPQGGQVLRLSAVVTAGSCGSAPEGYLVWGNGAVSGGSETGGSTAPSRRYVNPRFGFAVDVPPGFVEEEPGPANGDGAIFTSGQATLTASGGNNVFEDEPESAFQEAVEYAQIDGLVTYQVLLDDGYVISGTDADGRTFYQRTWVGDGSTNTIWWRYPDGYEGADRMVEASVESFSPGDLWQSH